MAVPKKKIVLNPYNQVIGKAREQELIDMISDKSVYLPRHVGLIDLDTTVIEYVNEDMEVIVEGKKIPVFFLTKEGWADLQMTWQQSDEEGNVVMPFITLMRSQAPKQGSNENVKYRIPQNKMFTYTKVPVYENGVFGIDIYRTPQPIPIDMVYEIRLFTHFFEDLNLLNEKIQFMFANGQDYINVKGYEMPMKLDDVGDESTNMDFEGNKFHCQVYTIILQGFIQDANNMDVIKGLRRAVFNIKEG